MGTNTISPYFSPSTYLYYLYYTFIKLIKYHLLIIYVPTLKYTMDCVKRF